MDSQQRDGKEISKKCKATKDQIARSRIFSKIPKYKTKEMVRDEKKKRDQKN